MLEYRIRWFIYVILANRKKIINCQLFFNMLDVPLVISSRDFMLGHWGSQRHPRVAIFGLPTIRVKISVTAVF